MNNQALSSDDGTDGRRLSSRWLVLFLLLLIYIFNFADRYLITGLVGPLKSAFGVDDLFIGLLMGPAFVILYVAMGIPIARLADRWSRVRIIAVGCIVWSLFTVLTGFAHNPMQLALARIGVGLGEAAFVAPAYSLLSAYFRAEQRGVAFAILGLATYFGQIGGQAVGPKIAAAHGWQSAFWYIGAPGIALGLLALLLIREPPRPATATGTVHAIIGLGPLARWLVRMPTFVLLMLGMGMGTLSGVGFGFWGPELFARAYGLAPEVAKQAFAVNFGGAGAIGILLFGIVSDRMAKRHPRWPGQLAAMALFSATVLILAVTWIDDFSLAKWLAIPSGLLGGGWSVGMMASLQYLLPDRFRATATALFVACTTLLGFLLGPSLVGGISSHFGDDALSLRYGLSVTIPFGMIGGVLAWLGAQRLDRDRHILAQRGE